MTTALVVCDLDFDRSVADTWPMRHTEGRRSVACTFDLVRVDRSGGRMVEVSRCRVCGATRRVEVW